MSEIDCTNNTTYSSPRSDEEIAPLINNYMEKRFYKGICRELKNFRIIFFISSFPDQTIMQKCFKILQGL